MRNRAKCKLCNSIVESFHHTDYVLCSCGEIALDGGEGMRCFSKDWVNFIRIDDDNNELNVKVIEKDASQSSEKPIVKKSKKELKEALDHAIQGMKNLPSHAMDAPVTHYDWLSMLELFSSILESD